MIYTFTICEPRMSRAFWRRDTIVLRREMRLGIRTSRQRASMPDLQSNGSERQLIPYPRRRKFRLANPPGQTVKTAKKKNLESFVPFLSHFTFSVNLGRKTFIVGQRLTRFLHLMQGVCRRGDSNPHGLPHTPLKRTCLPVPPLRLLRS